MNEICSAAPNCAGVRPTTLRRVVLIVAHGLNIGRGKARSLLSFDWGYPEFEC